jgi:stress-induced-phosphoprotein 1
MEKANSFRLLGNTAFQTADYKGALGLYTQAVTTDPLDAASWSNRSLVHHKLGSFDEALDDAQKALEVKPDWGRV